jgi:hypothetical protein
MKSKLLCSAVSICLLGFAASPAPAQAPNLNIGGNGVTVHGQFGGDIFGFDIDPNGDEGLLCEAVFNSDGTVHTAIETFDQTTGAIIAVVMESTKSSDDFVTLGVVGRSIGIVEQEHLRSLFHVARRYRLLNPLDSNKLNAPWTPGLDQNHIINQVKPSQADNDDVAVLALDTSIPPTPLVFTSHVAANRFSDFFPITDPVFTAEGPPLIAYDNVRHQVILGHDFPSEFTVPPRIGFLDLATGGFTQIVGQGFGAINGVAVDTADGVLCTDTHADSGVQFYDAKTRSVLITKLLPGAQPNTLTAAGGDIAFDPINKLFLIAQRFADGLLNNASCIQVYDTGGEYVETVYGLEFQDGFNVFPTHIALNPSRRLGFINGPNLNDSLQAFTY